MTGHFFSMLELPDQWPGVFLPLAARSTLLARLLAPRHVSPDLGHGLTSLTLSHSLETSASESCLQLMRLSIQPSSVGMEPTSCVRESLCGSDGLLTSISIFVSIAVFAGKPSIMAGGTD